MTRLFSVAALAGALASVADAQPRPDSRQMSCDEVQRLIERHGAVVLTTGRHTYDRFVAGRAYCPSPDTARVTAIPARDTPQCVVYSCGPRLLDHPWD